VFFSKNKRGETSISSEIKINISLINNDKNISKILFNIIKYNVELVVASNNECLFVPDPNNTKSLEEILLLM
jgi:hypothetical protein